MSATVASASPIGTDELTSPKYVERPNPFLALLPKETREVIEKITELLGDRDVLKTHVVVCFKKAVAGEGTDLSDDELDIRALQLFRDFLSEELRVPADAFGDIKVEMIRFDFTGSGGLSINEAYRLVKFHLRQYRKQLGGAPVTVDIPFRSLQLAGYNITKELGAGSQGTAKLATNQLGNQFCIKCYRKDKMNACGLDELKDEFEALQLLHCNSIAGAFEMFQDAHSFYMVGEAFYGGDFLTLKQRAKAQNVDMTEKWWRGVWKQCFEALAFMHKQAMIHCDIKEPNMMLKLADFRQPQVVIIDLGVAKAMAASDEGIPHGTPGYVPPETWETKKWFPTGDVFSLGVVIVQVMTDKSPDNGPRNKDTPGGIFVEGCSNVREIFLATQTRPAPMHLMPKDMQDLADLCERCLEKKMEDRPRSVEALKMPFFSSSMRRKKSSIQLDMNPRNRFATVGITKQFLEKFTHDHEHPHAVEEEDEDDEDEDDDDNTRQKKKEMAETLHQIQEAARRSGQSFTLSSGEIDEPLEERSAATKATEGPLTPPPSDTFQVPTPPQSDTFQVTGRRKPVNFDVTAEQARIAAESSSLAMMTAMLPNVEAPSMLGSAPPVGQTSPAADNKVLKVLSQSPGSRLPVSPPHFQRLH
jgi:serine/threonine protein kinase